MNLGALGKIRRERRHRAVIRVESVQFEILFVALGLVRAREGQSGTSIRFV